MTELYDAIGGEDGLAAAVEVFYARVTADPDVARYFDGVDLDRLRAHQRAFLRVALDGPGVFTGRPLGRAHAELLITGPHFDRVVDHLAATLGDLGVDGPAVALVRQRVEALRPLIVAPVASRG
jgi:hemoglobin